MNETLTLFKSDPRFKDYLTGRFSKDKRAVPIQSLNVGTPDENVTFEIIEVQDTKQPSQILIWLQMIRLEELFLLFLSTSLLVLFFQRAQMNWSPFFVLMSFLAVSSLYISTNFLNDYLGQIWGFDRENPNTGSQTIQRGWVRAVCVKRAGYAFLLMGAFLGAPSLLQHPPILIFVIILSAISGAVFLSYKMGISFNGAAESLSFFLPGPLLINGFSLASTGQINLEVFSYSLLVGWSSTLLLHLKNLERTAYDSRKSYKNWVGKMGFEKAKLFIGLWLLGFVFLTAWQVSFSQIMFMKVFMVAFAFFLSLFFFIYLQKHRLYYFKNKGRVLSWGQKCLYAFYGVYNGVYLLYFYTS